VLHVLRCAKIPVTGPVPVSGMDDRLPD